MSKLSTAAWPSAAQIPAYAAEHYIDLVGARVKADRLSAVASALADPVP